MRSIKKKKKDEVRNESIFIISRACRLATWQYKFLTKIFSRSALHGGRVTCSPRPGSSALGSIVRGRKGVPTHLWGGHSAQSIRGAGPVRVV